MKVRRSLAALLGLALLTACGGQEPVTTGTAEEAAGALAAALAEGSLAEIPIRQGDPEADLPVLLQGMSGMRPEVTVAHVSPSAQVANIKLAYQWPLSSPWNYEADAVMIRDGNAWQLNWAPSVLHPKLTSETRLERQRGDTSERGNITGRGDAVLVESRPMQMLGLNKTGLPPEQVTDSAHRVAEKAEVDPAAYVAKAQAAGADAFVDAVVVRQDDLPADFLAIPGAAMRTVMVSATRTEGYAKALLGVVAPATAEQAADIAAEVTEGDYIGVGGLQHTYDRELRGSTGNRVFLAERDAPIGSGRPTRATLLADFPDIPGEALSTTIDDSVQSAAERAVQSVQVPASVVVLELETGAIWAAADSPAARLRDDSLNAAFAPGPAASPVAALALLRSGVDLDERVSCEDEVVVGGRTFTNGEDYRGSSQVTLSRALSDGCVTAVAAMAEQLDSAKFFEAAMSLGLEQTPDLGVPLTMGSFPAPSGPAAQAAALTGSTVEASALAMATMAASSQAGRVVTPYVVPGREPEAPTAVPLSETEQQALQQLMRTRASSYRPLTAVSTGGADGRVWAVGYSASVAVAVVIADSDETWVTPAQLVRTVANAARAQSTTQAQPTAQAQATAQAQPTPSR